MTSIISRNKYKIDFFLQNFEYGTKKPCPSSIIKCNTEDGGEDGVS
jgi:hypothetical protein